MKTIDRLLMQTAPRLPQPAVSFISRDGSGYRLTIGLWDGVTIGGIGYLKSHHATIHAAREAYGRILEGYPDADAVLIVDDLPEDEPWEAVSAHGTS